MAPLLSNFVMLTMIPRLNSGFDWMKGSQLILDLPEEVITSPRPLWVEF
jgi:hypothetical protein